MPYTLCQLLEDYVSHDLSAADCARFEAHLEECLSCRQSLGQEHRLEALLGAGLSESLPPGFGDRLDLRLRAAKRRRLRAGVAAVAASLVFLLLGRALLAPETPTPEQHVELPSTPPPRAESPPAAQAQVRFPKDADVIAVPVPSESSNVTIVQVYPALHKVVRAKMNHAAIAERSVP
jgi:hypothetical protein